MWGKQVFGNPGELLLRAGRGEGLQEGDTQDMTATPSAIAKPYAESAAWPRYSSPCGIR